MTELALTRDDHRRFHKPMIALCSGRAKPPSDPTPEEVATNTEGPGDIYCL